MDAVKDMLSRFRKMPAFTGFILFMLALIINAAIQGPASFFSIRSINNLFTANMAFILIVIAQSVLLLSGSLDLSVGIQMALVNVVTIMSVQELGIPFVVGCLLGILAAMVISAVGWVCVAIFRLPDLLASFALIYAIQGINVLIMSVPQGEVDRVFYRAYTQNIFGFLPASCLALILVLLLWAYLRRTRFGTNIYAVGANPQNAFAAGISPAKVQFQAYMFKGFVIGIAGVCLTLMTASGNPLQGGDLGLRSLAACIIGGLTFGGWGSVACGVFGAGFFIMIQNSVYFFFNMLARVIPGFAVTTYWQNFLTDIIIFIGLLMTIITMRGQREALRASIQTKYSFKRRDTNAQ